MYYFASDIHLGGGDRTSARRVERRFLQWLSEIEPTAEALFLVGDVFDFWFEYGRVVPKGFVRVLGRLAEMTDRGIRVVMLTGNHDMWVGDYLQKECGVEVYTTPQTISIGGKTIYLAHGDNMNIKGQPLLRLMNVCFRSRILRAIFSWVVHPDLFVRFGQWWSGSSRKSHGEERDVKFLQPLVEYAEQYAAEHPDVDCFIFGHMHIIHSVLASKPIWFMGDWHSAPNCLVMDEQANITQQILD